MQEHLFVCERNLQAGFKVHRANKYFCLVGWLNIETQTYPRLGKSDAGTLESFLFLFYFKFRIV